MLWNSDFLSGCWNFEDWSFSVEPVTSHGGAIHDLWKNKTFVSPIINACFLIPDSSRLLTTSSHHTANTSQTWNNEPRKEALLLFPGTWCGCLTRAKLCPFKTLLHFLCVDDCDSTFDLKIFWVLMFCFWFNSVFYFNLFF